ncbi:recombinase family protein [Bradyrhizobium sp. USDA 4504]
MSASRLRQVISLDRPSSICANPAPHRSSTTANRRSDKYALVCKARELGWPDDRIIVIDEDLGLSGSGAVARSGFARLTAEVALARVGLVLGLEVSRLARNNAEWYRLIDLAGFTDTLIGDADGIYHPALFNDRFLLGLKGTMSEAELHVLRARLNGGIRNKAARGELRRGLPVGFVWGEADGEVRFHPDELSLPPFAMFLRAMPRWDRRVAFGSGFGPRGLRSRCSCTPVPTSAGARPVTPPSTRS